MIRFGQIRCKFSCDTAKYLLIAFDIESGCSKVLSFTCNLPMLPPFVYNHINVTPHFLSVCRIFKYIIVIKCAICFVNGNYFDAIN